MPNSDLLPSLLSKLYENQLALKASILELSNWVEQRELVKYSWTPFRVHAASLSLTTGDR